MRIAALIVAAGRGMRAGGGVPKQYASIGAEPVIRRTIKAFEAATDVTSVQVVFSGHDKALYEAAVPSGAKKLRPPVLGGATRQQSVLAGLEALATLGAAAPDLVLVHDAARPFISHETISAVIGALAKTAGAIAAVPLADTLKRADRDGNIEETIDRRGLWRAQTPQGFHFPVLLTLHRKAAAAGLLEFTDDAAIAEWGGLKVALVEDRADNVKITTAEDLIQADRRLTGTNGTPHMEWRTGTGFDVHTFTAGDHVWLGGVKIPHTHKLEGHSDADVVLHALTDAVLGAIGEADIGQHFPPSDPQWKGAASRLFLAHAAKLARQGGWSVSNVDITVLAEAPKVGPHRLAMKDVIAQALGITPDRVGIKATTMEGMGFVGRREGIAAMATATVSRPSSPSSHQPI